MISIKVDEAYAFDFLSILQVKADRNLTSYHQFDLQYAEIERQLRNFLLNEILLSEEYKALYAANDLTFRLVDKLKVDPKVTAKEVDDANKARYLAKQALQAKFFSKPLTETKTY